MRRILVYAESQFLTVVQRNQLLPWLSDVENIGIPLQNIEYEETILIQDILVPNGARGVEEQFHDEVVDVLLVKGGFKIDLKGSLTLKTFNHETYKFLGLLSKLHKGAFSQKKK